MYDFIHRCERKCKSEKRREKKKRKKLFLPPKNLTTCERVVVVVVCDTMLVSDTDERRAPPRPELRGSKVSPLEARVSRPPFIAHIGRSGAWLGPAGPGRGPLPLSAFTTCCLLLAGWARAGPGLGPAPLRTRAAGAERGGPGRRPAGCWAGPRLAMGGHRPPLELSHITP